jgi:glyoxylase-like metal-dependent hydrolase (beta-lactamase superfamily II)
VKRLQLENQEFEGNNSFYLLEGDGETALVDTGVSTHDVKDQFVENLAGEGVEVDEIDHVFLTHWHADHVGLSGYVQEESGATVHVHEKDAPLVEQNDEAWDSMEVTQRTVLEDWGMPEGKREALLSFVGSTETIYGEPPTVEAFDDGKRWSVAGFELEAVHSPGHTSGLTCYAMRDENEVFTGDAVLPVYTPNVGGADLRVEKPLEKYVETLSRLAGRDFDRAYPGHREPIDEPTERAVEIIEHHRERSERVADVLHEEGACDAWEMGAHLFGELEGIHILHGPGESYAHLEHMERHGVVSSYRDDEEGTVKYQLEDEEALEGCIPATDEYV